MPDVLTIRALRGATTVDDEGEAAGPGARAATHELLRELLARNDLTLEQVVSALFTLTDDLPGAAPALAAREDGWHEVPMLTAAEFPSPGSLPRCIRVLLHVETPRPRAHMRHVYLRGARGLRPDLDQPSHATG